jgi:hypothetical protein
MCSCAELNSPTALATAVLLGVLLNHQSGSMQLLRHPTAALGDGWQLISSITSPLVGHVDDDTIEFGEASIGWWHLVLIWQGCRCCPAGTYLSWL